MQIKKAFDISIILTIVSLLFINTSNDVLGKDVLQKMENEFIKIVQRVNPSVVKITATSEITADEITAEIAEWFSGPKKEGQFQQELKQLLRDRYYQRNVGSGIIIDKRGYIVTTVSVIQNADKIWVLAKKKKLRARLVGMDDKTNIAVIKVRSKRLPVALLGNSNNVAPGGWVFTVGKSYGDKPTFAFGTFSGIEILPNGPICDLMKLNARVNPGNSGGAVVNTSGQLIGMIAATLAEPQMPAFPMQSESQKNAPASDIVREVKTSGAFIPKLPYASPHTFWGQSTSFAIPINTVKRISQELINHGKVRRGWLGVEVKQIHSEAEEPMGVRVLRVAEQSPAARASVQQNDIIVALNGKHIPTTYDLKRFVLESLPDTTVQMKILRGKKEITVNVTLGERITNYELRITN